MKPERRVRIVDVGANPVNEPPYTPMLTAGCAEVYGFEPQKGAYEALMQEATAHTTFVNAAVGAGGMGTFRYWERAEGMSSLYPLRKLSARYLGRFRGLAGTEEEIEMPTRALDEIDDVPPIDMLKMDVQGAERDILRAGREKLKDAIVIIPEMRFYQLYKGEPSLGALDQELRRQGFVLHKFLPMSRTLLPSRRAKRLARVARTQLIDGDAVYIRPLENMAAWSEEALVHMVLCAVGAFRSYDLALMVLDELEDRGRVGPDVAEALIASLPEHMRAPS